MKELESEIARLEFDIEQERQRSFIEITTDKIIHFLKTALRPNYQDITARKVLVKYLIRDIIVYNDKIIINYYFTEPVHPHKRTESSAKETERAALTAAPLSASYCSNKCETSPPEKAPFRVLFVWENSSKSKKYRFFWNERYGTFDEKILTDNHETPVLIRYFKRSNIFFSCIKIDKANP